MGGNQSRGANWAPLPSPAPPLGTSLQRQALRAIRRRRLVRGQRCRRWLEPRRCAANARLGLPFRPPERRAAREPARLVRGAQPVRQRPPLARRARRVSNVEPNFKLYGPLGLLTQARTRAERRIQIDPSLFIISRPMWVTLDPPVFWGSTPTPRHIFLSLERERNGGTLKVFTGDLPPILVSTRYLCVRIVQHIGGCSRA